MPRNAKEVDMPGGMGKNSRSKKSYKGTCEEVDVKVFGSKDAKKHSKHMHHKAIRAEGKHQDDLDEREHDWPRKSGKEQINGIDVYQITCPHCSKESQGRLLYPSFTGADARYCDSCSNVKVWIDGDEKGPVTCECGGTFNSYDLICPSCKNVVFDAEKQLAVQFYIIEPAKVPGNPSKEEIDAWYHARKLDGFLTGTELFIQLDKLLTRDEETGDWKYFGRFEI